jgi:hypothetical protein
MYTISKKQDCDDLITVNFDDEEFELSDIIKVFSQTLKTNPTECQKIISEQNLGEHVDVILDYVAKVSMTKRNTSLETIVTKYFSCFQMDLFEQFLNAKDWIDWFFEDNKNFNNDSQKKKIITLLGEQIESLKNIQIVAYFCFKMHSSKFEKGPMVKVVNTLRPKTKATLKTIKSVYQLGAILSNERPWFGGIPDEHIGTCGGLHTHHYRLAKMGNVQQKYTTVIIKGKSYEVPET